MNKTFNINVGGYLFVANDDAFDLLKDYLETLRTAFSRTPDCSELIADIEQRIAELLSERPGGKSMIVTLDDVETIISRMGRPEEIAELEDELEKQEEEGKIPPPPPGYGKQGGEMPPPPFEPKPLRRRFYRNPLNKIIGGVCSGFAAYLNVDPTWVRLFTVLLAVLSASTIIIAYLILWIVIPEACTPIQQMEMRGESPTIANIGRTVNESFRRTMGTIDADYNSVGEMVSPRSGGKRLADNLASICGFIGRALLIIALILSTALLLGIGVALIGCIIGLIVFGVAPMKMGETSPNEVIFALASAIGYILTIGIPLMLLVWALYRSNRPEVKSLSQGWRIALITAWCVGIILAGIFTGKVIEMTGI